MLCPGTSLEKPSMIADLSNRIKVKISGADRPTEREQNLSERRQTLKYNQLFHSLLICLHVSFQPVSIHSVLLKFTFYPFHTYTVAMLTLVSSETDNKTHVEHHDNSKVAQILHLIYKLVTTSTLFYCCLGHTGILFWKCKQSQSIFIIIFILFMVFLPAAYLKMPFLNQVKHIYIYLQSTQNLQEHK